MDGQVVWLSVERPQGPAVGTLGANQVIEVHRLVEILEPVTPHIIEGSVFRSVTSDDFKCCSRQQDLAAIRRVHDPSRLIDVRSEVVPAPLHRLPSVDPDANSNPTGGNGEQLGFEVTGSHQRRRRRFEDSREPVSGVLDDLAPGAPHNLADQLIMGRPALRPLRPDRPATSWCCLRCLGRET